MHIANLFRLCSLCLALAAATAAYLPQPARASAIGLGDVVKTFCLSAFQMEMAQAGKVPPAGMANFACDCVADGITSGSSVDAARSNCKQATVKRYPI